VNIQAGKLPALIPAGIILLVCLPSLSSAEDEGLIPVACPNPAIAPVRVNPPDRQNAPITMLARNFYAQHADSAEASGDVELHRADQQINTEVLRYEPDGKLVKIPGPLNYLDVQISADAARAEFDLAKGFGTLTDLSFGLVGSTANGKADEMLLAASHRSLLKELVFTTCPGPDPEWSLSARELELRHAQGYGIARGAKLKFMNLPFLYVPWISFPIDSRRKSGFLYPHLSSANDNGFEMGIPYYWNIAPDKDATLTPRYFTDRGFMLTGESRMLSRKSAASLEFDYLLNDKKTRDNRYHYKLGQHTAINPQWRSTVLINRVSDDQYFQDFGLNLVQTARQFLRSSAGIDGGGKYWTFSLLADDFQVIDESVSEASEPYRRLPRIAYRLDRPLGHSGFQFALDSEVVSFDRNVGVTGVRTDLYPRLNWSAERHWGFVRSSIGYRHTAYNLDLQGGAGDESPDRGMEIVNLDAGMYFERTAKGGTLQTLEPRLFYLHVPYENQDALPDFDTAEFTFGFSQLFNTNRFTGADRQTDANQLTMAVSTRSLDPKSGRERWNLGVGQIFYFEGQRVMLNNNAPTDIDTSPLVAEFTWHPFTHFTGRIGAQWNWENRELDLGTFGLDHTWASGSRLGFEYRFRRDRLDQFDFRYFWPVNERWRVLTRLKYSLEDSDPLETQVGIEYESCCWSIRLISQRYLRSRDGDERDAIYLELNLKGLGSFGRRPRPLFYDEAD
jgi:LPS-assembly protein